ncbi:ribbon-helix-helix protein, CopG family [Variovorax sp. 350MFTsu5.1]
MTPDMLSKVDRLARVMGQSRAAVINLAIYRLLEQERA